MRSHISQIQELEAEVRVPLGYSQVGIDLK